METTVGKILLKHNVPVGLKTFVHENHLDKKGINSLFNNLAANSPELYKEAVTNLARLGFEVSTRQGSTVALSDLVCPIDKDKYFKDAEDQIAEVHKGSGNKHEKLGKAAQIYSDLGDRMNKDILVAGLKNNQTLAKVILSGARGSPTQYRQTIAAPVLVNDEKGRPLLDFPIKQSFAEGLSAPEYLAHAFGTRQGTVATKLAVADSGYFSKQLARASMTIRVEEHDCGTDNGIEADITDKDSVGCYLAHSAGKYNKNNEVTPSMLADLRNSNIKHIVIRSPITCQSARKAHAWSVCQMCVGKRERGTVPHIGEYVGITAATALGEPLAQGQLNTKHQSGSATFGKTVSSGFKLIDQIANIPSTFQNKAAVAEFDGVVEKIRPAPQGGTYIRISHGQEGKDHYVPAGFNANIKVGDHVEAGDVLSEGIVNPHDIVHHKGVGEGRRYFADTMRQTFDAAGMGVNRRNFELIAKAAIDHVRITHPDGLGEHLPNAVVSYQSIEKDYKPRETAQSVRIDLARGKYLEEPVLHYSIGTRITTKVIEALKRNNIQSIKVHNEPPPFHPEMQRLLEVPATIPDWAHQLYSTYLEKRLVNAVNTGMKSYLKGPSPILGLAHGVGFGEHK